MTTLFARIGALESRLASRTLWSSGKRKRGEWICAECRNRRDLRQRRVYSDDTLRLSPEQYLYSPRETQDAGSEQRAPVRRAAWGLQQRAQSARSGTSGIQAGDRFFTPREVNPLLSAAEDDGDEGQQSALWEQFERAEGEAETHTENIAYTAAHSLQALQTESLQDIDYVSTLPAALVNNEPDLLARCLLAADQKDDLDFIRSIPANTFAECLRILQPSNFTATLFSAHVEISEPMAEKFGLMPIQAVAWQHADLLRRILGTRSSAGIRLGLHEYKILLRSARDLGQKHWADKLWTKMLDDGCTPDTACYNYFMAANVFNEVHSAQTRHQLRVSPFHLLARRQRRLGRAFTNFRVGGGGGLKQEVMEVFSDMLKHGAVADEESFRNVITAAAREGDVATVKSVLKKVWDIEVDAVTAGTVDAGLTGKKFAEDSPLRPTSNLLFTLAHAFGTNNDVPTALRLVDFIARRYDITITLETWSQLFEWTFVLAVTRSGTMRPAKIGQLPKQSVLSLWQTMTGEPYNVQPTIGMYNSLIKNLQQRSRPWEMESKMIEGRELYIQSRYAAQAAWKRLRHEITRLEKYPSATSDIPLETLRRDVECTTLIRKRNLFWCKRWLRLYLFTSRDMSRQDQDGDFTARELPRVLWEWRAFAPSVVAYEIRSGFVEIKVRTPDERKQHRMVKEEKSRDEKGVLGKVPVFLGEGWVKGRES